MAKLQDVFPSNYYKAADLPAEGLVVTIAAVGTEVMPDGKEKRCLKFEEGVKKLILNRTNWTRCADVTKQDDDAAWVGQKIRLEAQKVEFKGDVVDAVRVTTPEVPF